MTAIAVLFVAGLILMGFEVFLPGGILGIFAGLAMLAGCALAFVNYGLDGGVMAMVTAIVLLGAMFYFEFAILPKTRLGQRLFLKAAVDGTTGAGRERDFIGSTGTTATALGPSGYVLIDGQRHEAFSRTGFLDEGVAIKVVGADNFRLIVVSLTQ